MVRACLILAMWTVFAAVAAWPAVVRAQSGEAASDVTVQAGILLDRTNTVSRAARVEAARRLVTRDTADADAVLAAALQEAGNPAAQFAAASALSTDATPRDSLVDPLFVLIAPDVPLELAKPAAAALARYVDRNNLVLTRLIDRTVDRRGEPSRRAAILSLGLIPDKRAAAALMSLLQSEDESNDVRQSAVSALSTMTGATANSGDVGQWNAWWTANRDLPDNAFRQALVTNKADRFTRLLPETQQLTAALREQLGQMYRVLPEERRAEQMLSMLENDAPAIRMIAAEIVREEKSFAAVIPDAVQDRLRVMVGDSDPGVRYAVANALGSLNYAPALDALLAQLPLEANPEVRAQIARALAPIQDLRAVPVLLDLLRDENRAVVRAAALSLKDLGEKLRKEGSAEVVDRATRELRTVLRSTANSAAGEELRATVVEAMVPLAREDLLPDLQPLLTRTEPPAVRRSAIKALARIGMTSRPEVADSIVPALADRDASVRLEAARAFQQLRRPELIAGLLSRLDPANEPDATVQDAAWAAIRAQLPDAPAQRLWNILPQFPTTNDRDRARRIEILLALEKKLTSQPDQLADAREDIGKTHLDGGAPGEAVDFFRSALAHHRTSGTANNIARLTERLMAALLKSEKYPEAMAFAAESIAADPANAQVMGSAIKREAQELANAGRDAAAQSLITSTEELQPPLPDQYRRGLAEIEGDIKRRNIDGLRDNATPPRGPRSASGSRPLLPLPSII